MTEIKKRKGRLKIAVILWAIFLVLLALEPDPLVESILPTDALKSIAHSVAYGSLAGLLWIYFRFRRRFLGLSMSGAGPAIWAFLGAVSWGGATEILQMFSVDRYASWEDLYFDMLGAVIGILTAFFLNRKSRARSREIQRSV